MDEANPAAPILELIESSRISDTALLPDPPPKLGEVDEVAPHAALVTEDPNKKTHHGERPNNLPSNARRRVGILHVRLDEAPLRPGPVPAVPARGAQEVDGFGPELRRGERSGKGDEGEG